MSLISQGQDQQFTPPLKIEILPEDLDKAVEATKRAGKWSQFYCLLAQVGMRVLGETEVIGCGYYAVTMKSGNKLNCANKTREFVEQFDTAVERVTISSKIDEAALANLRALLPVDITP